MRNRPGCLDPNRWVRERSHRKILDTVLLRREDWLAKGAALGPASASTIRSYRTSLPFMVAPMLLLVFSGSDAKVARYFMLALCLGALMMWPYYATMVRGYDRKNTTRPAAARDQVSAISIRLLQTKLDGFELLFKIVFWILVIVCLLMLPGWLASL